MIRLSALFKEERLFSPSEALMGRRYIANFLGRYAEKSVLIVSGELNPNIYESPSFISAARNFISRGAMFEIISSKTKEKLMRRNPLLFKIAYDMQRVRFYVAKERPIYHFIVCDEKTVLIQGVHQEGKIGEMYFVEDEPKLAKKYVERFRKLASDCEEIVLKEN